MKKKVLFLMFAFPNMNESFNMYTALVDMFKKHKHIVTVIAPDSKINETITTIENGIEVLRVKTQPIKNVSNIRKGIGNLLIPYEYKKGINKFYKDREFDLIIMPTPPITLGSLTANLKKKHNAKVYLILRDIFPQNAVDLGFMKNNSLLHKFFKIKEINLYNTADSIGCMSEGNINFIKNNTNTPDSKLHILRNWQYINNEEHINTNTIREKYQLLNKFIVVFGGNMGKPQQLENVIELANKSKNIPEIVFLLLGEGVMMDRIRVDIRNKKLKNVIIHGSIPKIEYQSLIKASDIGLISLHSNFTIPNIPSKALDYWNIGIPILASIDKTTDFGEILDNTKTGLWAYAGNHSEYYDKLMTLFNDKELRDSMSENGKKYFRRYLTPEISYNTIIENI